MNRTLKRALASLLSGALVLTMAVGAPALAAEPDTVTIYHTNDMHASMISDAFNLAHVTTIKKSTPNSLLLDAGDATQGQPFSMLTKGKSVFELMNAAGYDAMVLGNHEFDYPQETLLENVKTANFPVLAGNLQFGNGSNQELKNELARDYIVETVGGHKIAIFGMISPETSSLASPDKLKGLDFLDVKAETTRILNLIDQNETDIDAIVCLAHCGWSTEEKYSSKAIAEAGAGKIDVIIDGHTHQDMLEGKSEKVGDTLIVSSGSTLANLGKLTLTFSGHDLTGVSTGRINKATVEAENIQPDPTCQAAIDKVKAMQEASKTQKVGNTQSTLYASKIQARALDEQGNVVDTEYSVSGTTEANLYDLVADSRRWEAKEALSANATYKNYDYIGYICSGNVRATIPAGEITMENVYQILPWSDSPVIYVAISPKTLYDMVEVGVSSVTSQDAATGQISGGHGHFLIPSGFTYTYDLSKPAIAYQEYTKPDGTKAGRKTQEGQRVTEIKLEDGTVLDRNDDVKSIVVTSGTYNLGGGDGFWGFTEDDAYTKIGSGDGEKGIFVRYLEHLSAQPENKDGIRVPVNGGRIRAIGGGYTAESYQASITALGAGERAADATFQVRVDGGEAKAYKTDDKGQFALTLSNGPHEVTVFKEGAVEETLFYLNNYAGILSAVVESESAIPADKSEPSGEEGNQGEENNQGQQNSQGEEEEPADGSSANTGDAFRPAAVVVALSGAALTAFLLRKKRR